VAGSTDEADDRVVGSRAATAGLEVRGAVRADCGEQQHVGAGLVLDDLDLCARGDPGLYVL
jgi:hypothetical protein